MQQVSHGVAEESTRSFCLPSPPSLPSHELSPLPSPLTHFVSQFFFAVSYTCFLPESSFFLPQSPKKR